MEDIRHLKIPPLLSVTSAPPRNLYAIGDASCLERICIAIVGTRRPSPYGVKMAFQLGRELACAGFCVVSGLARGIDGAAHAGALAGALPAAGLTAAVLGHGLDRIYPSEHFSLAKRIVSAGGVLLSEYCVGTPPLARHFPARNRIIAGLCKGVIVIEAAEKSGSLITAGFAADEGRDVYVIPARAGDQSFLGSHKLIQDGAKLVTRAEDIICEYASASGTIREADSESCSQEWGEAGHLENLENLENLKSLEKLFSVRSGLLTLSQVREQPELEEAFRAALSMGEVVEYSLQSYLWVGKGSAVREKRSLPTDSKCDTL